MDAHTPITLQEIDDIGTILAASKVTGPVVSAWAGLKVELLDLMRFLSGAEQRDAHPLASRALCGAVETTARALRKQAYAGADVDALTPFLQHGLLAGATADHIKAVAIPTYVANKRIAEATAEFEAAAKRAWPTPGIGAPTAPPGPPPGSPPVTPAAAIRGGDICRDHRRGACTRGNACRFHHG
jgi:hypothetical protein